MPKYEIESWEAWVVTKSWSVTADSPEAAQKMAYDDFPVWHLKSKPCKPSRWKDAVVRVDVVDEGGDEITEIAD